MSTLSRISAIFRSSKLIDYFQFALLQNFHITDSVLIPITLGLSVQYSHKISHKGVTSVLIKGYNSELNLMKNKSFL